MPATGIAELSAEMLGDEPEAETSWAVGFGAGAEIAAVVAGAVALTSNVGAADGVDASDAVEVVTTVVIGTATVCVAVAVVVETTVDWTDSVTVWTCDETAGLAGDWMLVGAAELIGALFDELIRGGAGVGVLPGGAGALL